MNRWKRKQIIGITLTIIAIMSIVVLLQLTNHGGQNLRIAGTVDFSDTYATVSTLYQRKTFFAEGNFWLFYCNGTSLYYTSSSDGVNWRTPTKIASGLSASAMSVWYDGTIHYADAPASIGQPVTYQTGQIVGNNIVWNNPQVVIPAVDNFEYYNAYCTVDSFGNPWVSAMRFNISDNTYQHSWTVQVTTIDSSKGKTWRSPMQVANGTLSDQRPCILPLSNGKMYVLYSSVSGIKGRLWDGKDWQQVETITNRKLVSAFGFSAVSLENEVHVATLENSTNDVYYYRRAADGQCQETLVQTNQNTYSCPLLSVDSAKKVEYCIWMQNDGLQMWKLENEAWTKVETPTLNIISPTEVSCFYNVTNRKLGVAFLERLSLQDEIYRLRYSVIDNLS